MCSKYWCSQGFVCSNCDLLYSFVLLRLALFDTAVLSVTLWLQTIFHKSFKYVVLIVFPVKLCTAFTQILKYKMCAFKFWHIFMIIYCCANPSFLIVYLVLKIKFVKYILFMNIFLILNEVFSRVVYFGNIFP